MLMLKAQSLFVALALFSSTHMLFHFKTRLQLFPKYAYMPLLHLFPNHSTVPPTPSMSWNIPTDGIMNDFLFVIYISLYKQYGE